MIDDLVFSYRRVAVRYYPGARWQWLGNTIPVTLLTYGRALWKIEQFCRLAVETYGLENAKLMQSDTEQGILLHELDTD